MSNSILTCNDEFKVRDLFEKMDISDGVISDKLALAWLEKHKKNFCGYVNGSWLQKEKDVKFETNHHVVYGSFNGKHLCDIYAPVDDKFLSSVAENSSVGFKAWSTMTPVFRSKILYNIAQAIEKNQQLFANVEAVSSGKPIFRVKDKDVVDLIESFNFYATCAAQIQKEWYSTGPVCVVTEEYNNPCLTFSLRVSSLLASGNSVLLLADIKSSLSSFLLAEICSESGLPGGVLNVIPIDQANFNFLGNSSSFSKLIFTGSLDRSISYSKLSAEAHTPCDFLILRRPVVIIYEKSELYSAAIGVLKTAFSHDTRSKSGGCKVMIQESVSKDFLRILNGYFSKMSVGENMSDAEMFCIVTEEQKNVLTECLEEAKKVKGDVTSRTDIDDKTWNYTHMMPTLVSNVPSNLTIALKELGGPIIVVTPFRTISECINMFNCDNKGSPVSIWIDKVPIAMEVAFKLKTGTIWMNSENVFDAKIPYHGVYLSGSSVEGGKEALLHHMTVTVSEKSIPEVKEDYKIWLSSSSKFEASKPTVAGLNVKEYKLFIGGTFQCSKNGTINYDASTYIPSATTSDIDNAVSSAVAAQPKWESLTDLQKRKIFFAVIDKLKKSKAEYVAELHNVTKIPVNECEKEFDLALDLLYELTIQDDNYCQSIKEIKKYVWVSQNRYPLGVVGLQCPDEKPLLSIIVLVFSAILHGNSVVAISSELYPTIALKMCEIFASTKVPSGVINIICGNNKILVPALCKNPDVNVIWFTDAPPKVIYDNSHVTQRIFCCNKIWTDFNKAKYLKCTVESTFIKSILLPIGEIFAN